MRRARTSAAGSAAALLYCLGMPVMISHAFVPHIPHSARRCQRHPVQLHLSAKKVPSFKPSWDSPRRGPVEPRRVPGVIPEAAPEVDSAGSVVAAAAAQAVSAEAAAGDGAASSPARPRSRTYSYSKASWRPSPASKERKRSSSSSSSPAAAAGGTSPSIVVPSDAAAATSGATTAPTTPGASAAPTTRTPNAPPPPPAQEAVTVAPTRIEPVKRPTATAQVAAVARAATVETPAAAAAAAASPLAAPPTTPTLPLEPRGSAAVETVAMSLRRVKDALAPFSKKIQDNIAEGTFGERGEEWAILQVAILVCVGLGTVPLVGGLVTTLAGPGLVAVGIALAAAGVSGLGQSLSPWPAPVKDNDLKTDGIYGIIRHPTYTGLVMFCLGFGVITDSPLRMLLAVLLGVVLVKKVEKEENMLMDFHGEAYGEYRAKVAKFLPKLY